MAQICVRTGVDCLEIRGISNLVADRDMSAWDIPRAAESAQRFVLKYLEDLNRPEPGTLYRWRPSCDTEAAPIFLDTRASSFTEDGGADPYQGCPFLDGGLKVTGHAHGKLLHLHAWNGFRGDQIQQPFQFRKIGAGRLGVVEKGGHGHQPPHP